MNVLVLNGGPKGAHSNTMKLTKAFLEGFTRNRSIDTEIVDIYKLNIRECLGCFACWSKTPGKCAITDDMTDVLHKPTVFEYITVFAVSLVSLLSVLGYPTDILVPASYLAFGLMWTVTVFKKIPLSALYSMNNYGVEKALANPLFMRTNRILTACWGALYLLHLSTPKKRNLVAQSIKRLG